MAHTVKGIIASAKGAPVGSADITVPDPGPGEALVRVKACGVCHTDLHYREGAINDDFPFLLGHEASGAVESVGPGVDNVAPGDFVVIAWRSPCGACRSCLRGRPWYCFASRNAKQAMTLSDGTPLSPALGIGAFAELTLVDAGQAVKVNPAINPEAAGLIGCGVMAGLGAAINTGGVSRGDSVAVFGCGGVGDAAIAGSRLAGAHTIIAVDIDDRKLGWAKSFGATHTINSTTTDPVQAIRDITGGNGVNVSIEAVGNPSTYEQAFYAQGTTPETTRAGRRAQPRNENRTAPARSLRQGRQPEVLLVRRLPSIPGLPHLHRPSTCREGSTSTSFVSETITLGEVEAAFGRMQEGEVLRSVVVF